MGRLNVANFVQFVMSGWSN